MNVNFSTLFQILEGSPGHLIYHLVITLSILFIVVIAILHLKNGENPNSAKHILIYCSIMIGIQVLLYTLGEFFTPSVFNANPAMALLERMAYGLIIIWTVWVFFEDDPKFLVSGISIFLTLAIIFFGFGLILVRSLELEIMPEITQLQIALSQIGTLFLVLLGIIFLIRLRPEQWLVAALILAAVGGGYLIQTLGFEPEDLGMGAVRLALTLSLPWLLVLTQNFRQTNLQKIDHLISLHPDEISDRIDIKPQLVKDLLNIALVEKTSEKQAAIAQAISLGAVADICFLAQIDHENQAVQLIAGYDLIRQVFLKASTLPIKKLDQIFQAWQVNQPLHLTDKDDTTPDGDTLTKLLRIHSLGHLVAYPLRLAEQPLAGGVIFLSPYTGKNLEQALVLMDEIDQTLARVLFEPDPLEKPKAELEKLRLEYINLHKEKELLTQLLQEKEGQMSNLESDLNNWKAKFQVEKLDSTQRIDHMKDELAKLNVQLSEKSHIPRRLEQMKEEFRQLTQERDQLREALDEASERIIALESPQEQTGPIRLSIENRVISLDAIAANARLELVTALREKQIELEIVNPEATAMIKTDPGLVHTVVNNLLINAIKASNRAAQVQLNQKLSFETGMLVIQVTDFGKGLTSKEQSALFSSNPPEMPGIGSLESIREAVRAIRVLNGKIWLRSKPDSFTTFRVQLPVRIID